MTDISLGDVTVTRRDVTPKRVEVKTRRRESEFTYWQTYTFKMDGSTAVLVSIESDGETFNVQANADTARLACDSVSDLPFVQGVVMFPEVHS